MDQRRWLVLGAAWVSVAVSASSSSTGFASAEDEMHPTARYGSLRVARDSVKAIVCRALGAWTDSARWAMGKELFFYRPPGDTGVRVSCLSMAFVTRSDDAPGATEIENALLAAGWASEERYSADDVNGSVTALSCREAICRIEATWDGTDDPDDTTYVRIPGESVRIQIVPPRAVIVSRSRHR